jgi:hypothetical protein
MKKPIIIGSQPITGIIGKSTAHLIPDNVIIVNPQQQFPSIEPEPYIITNPYPLEYSDKNQFICKGKH